MGPPKEERRTVAGPIVIFPSGLTAQVASSNNKVSHVTANDARYVTREGLRVGTSAIKVIAAMGPPHVRDDVDAYYNYDYPGIIFGFYNDPQDNKVTFIQVSTR